MKRFKKILKWAVIVAGSGIAVVLLTSAFFVWRIGGRLDARLAELKAAGEPVQIADLGREPIPPETNAETYLGRADDDLKAVQKELEALYPRVGYPPKAPTPAEREKLEKIFADHPGLMPMLEKAADAPDDDPKLDAKRSREAFLGAVLDRAAERRPVYRVLRARSELLLAQGRPDDAVRAQLLLLRLTRWWRRDPMLMGYLVTAVGDYTAMEAINRVLQVAPVAPETRAALDAELARHDTTEGYAHALRTERAFSLQTAREMPGSRFWPIRLFRYGLSLRLLDLYDQYLGAASQPFLRVAKEREATPRPRFQINPYSGLATMLEPGLFAGLEATDRVRAMARSLRVLNALQARPKGDRAPPLAELGLPAEATVDPFDGEPIRVKASPRGWTVYSVGRNGVDDGGRLERAADIGVGPVDEGSTKAR